MTHESRVHDITLTGALDDGEDRFGAQGRAPAQLQLLEHDLILALLPSLVEAAEPARG